MAICNSTRVSAAPAATASPFPRLYRAHITADSDSTDRTAFVEALSHQCAIRKVADTAAQVAVLSEALRDAARWLQSAGDICRLQSLKDAAARAQATLAEVSHV